MNHYQKMAIFAVRVAGVTMAAVGAMGPITIAVSDVLGRGLPKHPAERWTGSLSWVIWGIVLVLLANRIGRLLGKGLD